MASTLVRRIVDPDEEAGQEKLPIHGIVFLMREVLAGRLPDGVLLFLMSEEEKVDCLAVMALVTTGVWTLSEVESLFMGGELGYYSVANVEYFLGL